MKYVGEVRGPTIIYQHYGIAYQILPNIIFWHCKSNIWHLATTCNYYNFDKMDLNGFIQKCFFWWKPDNIRPYQRHVKKSVPQRPTSSAQPSNPSTLKWPTILSSFSANLVASLGCVFFLQTIGCHDVNHENIGSNTFCCSKKTWEYQRIRL